MVVKGRHTGRYLAGLSLWVICIACAPGCGSTGYFVQTDGRLERIPEQDARSNLKRWIPDDVPHGAVSEVPEYDLEKLAYALHVRINEVRHQKGLKPLEWSETLVPLAQGHSQDMAKNGYFGHENLVGEDATRRAVRMSIDVTAVTKNGILEGVGENLYLTQLYSAYTQYRHADGSSQYVFEWKTADDLAAQAIEAWLESPGHRKNLLSTLYTYEAIGVSVGPNETLFVTQNLSGHPETRMADASF